MKIEINNQLYSKRHDNWSLLDFTEYSESRSSFQASSKQDILDENKERKDVKNGCPLIFYGMTSYTLNLSNKVLIRKKN